MCTCLFFFGGFTTWYPLQVLLELCCGMCTHDWFAVVVRYEVVHTIAINPTSLQLAAGWQHFLATASVAGTRCAMPAIKLGYTRAYMGPCGLMDKALVFGTKDCRFESCQGHIAQLALRVTKESLHCV